MYINFKALYSLGYTADELVRLCAIRQKEDFIPEKYEAINRRLTEDNLIEWKKDVPSLTAKGTSFLTTVCTKPVDTNISEICADAIRLYDDFFKESGNRLEVERRMAWFVGETGFNKTTILDAVAEHLAQGNYTLSLPNLIWKPLSTAFSVHMKLAQSKLFDLIARKFGINTSAYFNSIGEKEMNRNKTLEYMFELSKLPYPTKLTKPEYTFTGSANSDKEQLAKIKQRFFSEINKF